MFIPPHYNDRLGVGHTRTLRKITEDEWARVQAAVTELGLICAPHNACMGFNFGVAFYAAPTYPGLPPEFLLELTGEHFDLRFKDAWARLSPLTHNDANAARLALFGFRELREESYYDY